VSAGTVCQCGARGEHANCSAKRVAISDRLHSAVLDALPARSANEVVRRVGRQRGLILAALRALEADGFVVKTSAGLEARPHLPQTGNGYLDRGGCNLRTPGDASTQRPAALRASSERA
jgi:hypothetical protein